MEKTIIELMPIGLIPYESKWEEMAPYTSIEYNSLNEKEKINWLKNEFGTPCFWVGFPIYSNGVYQKNSPQINHEVTE